MTNFSFKHAYRSLPANKMREVRERIKTELNIQDFAFYARLRGNVEPKMSEAAIIQNIFAEYGILQVWDQLDLFQTN
jgi:hypothetical protein